MLKPLGSLLAFGLSLALFSTPGFAAQIAKVKGKQVLIDTQGDAMKPGEVYYVIDLGGARKAVLKVTKVKGSRALAVLGKGKAQVGMGLERRLSGKAARTARVAPESYGEGDSYGYGGDSGGTAATAGAFWGGMLGISMDSLTADIITDAGVKQGTASTSGMSFSLKGTYDHRLFDRVWFRGMGGVESFKSEGGSTCGTGANQSCNVNIMYLSGDAIGRYLFSEESFRPWVGGGLSLLFPLSKDSTLLQQSSITNTYALIFAGGADWLVSPTMMVPLSLEYGMLPKSETVEASWIQFRAGVSFPF